MGKQVSGSAAGAAQSSLQAGECCFTMVCGLPFSTWVRMALSALAKFWASEGNWNLAWQQHWAHCIPAQLPQPLPSLSPRQGWLANKCIYLVSMRVVAPAMHAHPHMESSRLEKTKAFFAGMRVMKPKLKRKQWRDMKLKCSHCVCYCNSQFSTKILQTFYQMWPLQDSLLLKQPQSLESYLSRDIRTTYSSQKKIKAVFQWNLQCLISVFSTTASAAKNIFIFPSLLSQLSYEAHSRRHFLRSTWIALEPGPSLPWRSTWCLCT